MGGGQSEMEAACGLHTASSPTGKKLPHKGEQKRK